MAKRAAVPRGAGDGVLSRVRVPLMQKGSLLYNDETEAVFVIDLGLAGIFVERKEPLEIGERVEVSFRLPRNEIPVQATCRVAWWHPEGGALVSKALPPGLGLAFVDLSEGDRAKIREELRDYFRRQPRDRRFSRNWISSDDEGQ